MGQEDQYLAKNDEKYHFRAKIGRFWANYGKHNTLPKFCRTQISFLGSVLTSYGSKTHHNPWASVSQLIFLKMTKYTTLGLKLAVLGLISAKLSLYLSFAAPKFHSWDLFWLFFGSKTHHNPWASVSQLIFLKMTKYTTLGPKLAVFGLFLAKLSRCLSFAAPKFHSWDLFWLLLAAKLIAVHEQAWASSFV